jgi:hypothetical protein
MAHAPHHARFLLLGAILVLGGCSFAADTLWPSASGAKSANAAAQATAGSGAPQTIAIAPSAAEANPNPTLAATPAPPPRLGTTNFVPPSVSPGQPTGTFVGQKVVQIRNELQRLQDQIKQENQKLQANRARLAQHSQRYHGLVAAINSRLQLGTTPGNPELVNNWNAAQGELAKVDNDISDLNALANEVASTSTLSAYLLETTRAAYGLTGAVDADHRQLAILEDEVNRTVVLIDRLLNELSEDISRQSRYLGRERGNLTTLSVAIKNGELFGTSLTNRAFATAAPPRTALAAPARAGARAGAPAGKRRPLVVIRFDRPNVEYEQALYSAVSRALERRPDAIFDLVAIAPSRGSVAKVTVASNTAKRNAETVLRSLANMGLPLERVKLSATTSPAARANEVHLYVR